MFRLFKAYKSVVHGIAFVPLLTTLVLTLIALTLTLNPFLQSWKPYVPKGGYFEVHTAETARSILSALLSGIISITVFGFSMMMVVVNQASSNYSPKVVETLSSQRSNQYILGVYLGSVVFTLVVMMHIDSKEIAGGIPQFALLVNMLLAVYCILLFVKFIHNISNAVRITNIIENIFKKTRASIRAMDKLRCREYTGTTDTWQVYCANHAGYFQVVRLNPLMKILMEYDCILKVVPKAGTYYTGNSPLFQLNKNIREQAIDEIRATFITYTGEKISENPMYGFRQLREVAVKALSPGINDPGVAILCIDHLSELLSMWMCRSSDNTLFDKAGHPRVILNTYTFAEMLELSLVPIKMYGKKDYTIVNGLLTTVYTISSFDKDKAWQEVLNAYAKSVLRDGRENGINGLEHEVIVESVKKLNRSGYFNVAS